MEKDPNDTSYLLVPLSYIYIYIYICCERSANGVHTWGLLVLVWSSNEFKRTQSVRIPSHSFEFIAWPYQNQELPRVYRARRELFCVSPTCFIAQREKLIKNIQNSKIKTNVRRMSRPGKEMYVYIYICCERIANGVHTWGLLVLVWSSNEFERMQSVRIRSHSFEFIAWPYQNQELPRVHRARRELFCVSLTCFIAQRQKLIKNIQNNKIKTNVRRMSRPGKEHVYIYIYIYAVNGLRTECTRGGF